MNYEELKSCIGNLEMRKNYQPVIIKTLLESPNYKSSREQVISKLREASQNPDKKWSMVFWDRIKEQFSPKKKPNFVKYDKKSKILSLIVDGKLSDEQESTLIKLCDEQIAKMDSVNQNQDEMSKDDELYKLAKHGVSRTHIECLIWFRENEGKVVDTDTLRGKRVPGQAESGYGFSARIPIPPNNIVSELHYLHSGIRGAYKPQGEKIVGYDNVNRKAIWEGEDNFVQSIQTGSEGTLDGYGKEIEVDANGNWTKINYNHLPDLNY